MGPLGFDFFTMFCSTDAFLDAGTVHSFMKEFHDSLPDNIKAKYTFDDMVEDVKATSATFAAGVVAVMAGQIAGYGAMPEDKRKYTWELFWPEAFTRAINMLDQTDAYEFNEKLAGL